MKRGAVRNWVEIVAVGNGEGWFLWLGETPLENGNSWIRTPRKSYKTASDDFRLDSPLETDKINIWIYEYELFTITTQNRLFERARLPQISHRSRRKRIGDWDLRSAVSFFRHAWNSFEIRWIHSLAIWSSHEVMTATSFPFWSEIDELGRFLASAVQKKYGKSGCIMELVWYQARHDRS